MRGPSCRPERLPATGAFHVYQKRPNAGSPSPVQSVIERYSCIQLETTSAFSSSSIYSYLTLYRSHVFRDVLAYTCIFDGCPTAGMMFEDFESISAHFGFQHGLAPRWDCQKCPLCLERTGAGKNTITLHFGRHLEEIALGALPHTTDSDVGSDYESDDEVISAHRSTSTSCNLKAHRHQPNDPQALGGGAGTADEFPLIELPPPHHVARENLRPSQVGTTEDRELGEPFEENVNGSGAQIRQLNSLLSATASVDTNTTPVDQSRSSGSFRASHHSNISYPFSEGGLEDMIDLESSIDDQGVFSGMVDSLHPQVGPSLR